MSKGLRQLLLFAISSGIISAVFFATGCEAGSDYEFPYFTVTPTAETEGLTTDFDDPAIWVNTADISKSLILATDKEYGLRVFNLSGKILQSFPDGLLNNVDIRNDFEFGSVKKPLAMATNRRIAEKNTITCYTIDVDGSGNGSVRHPATKVITVLDKVPSGINVTGDIYGIAMYKSAVTGRFYVFANFKSGWIIQLELTGNADETIDAVYKRAIKLDSLPEGMVADDELGNLFAGEEQYGIWRFKAEPGASVKGYLVDSIGSDRIPSPDIEGMAIYKTGTGSGLLVVSSQGDSSYCMYKREGNNDFIAKFSIMSSDTIDRVTETDGLDVVSVNLNSTYSKGMLVVQDDINDGYTKNLKLISWDSIEAAAILEKVNLYK